MNVPGREAHGRTAPRFNILYSSASLSGVVIHHFFNAEFAESLPQNSQRDCRRMRSYASAISARILCELCVPIFFIRNLLSRSSASGRTRLYSINVANVEMLPVPICQLSIGNWYWNWIFSHWQHSSLLASP